MTAPRPHSLDDAPRLRRAPEQTVKVPRKVQVQTNRERAPMKPLRSAGAAVVKVAPYRHSVKETISTLAYVLEKASAAEDDWARDLDTAHAADDESRGRQRVQEQCTRIAKEWGIRDDDGRVSAHIVLSLPNSDPKAEWDAAREAARACFPNSPYICALHTDTANPHVHVVVCMRDHHGKKLRIDRETLHEYRQALALAGRERGIAVEARRYRVPTRLRDKGHVFSTAEPVRRVLDRQIAVIEQFAESTPTQVRQACKTLARHQREMHDQQRHKLLRAAGKLEAHPTLRSTAQALTRLAFKAPSGEHRPVRQRASVSPPTIATATPAKPAPGSGAPPIEPASLDTAMAAPAPIDAVDEPAAKPGRKRWTTVSLPAAGLGDAAKNLTDAAGQVLADRAAQVRQPIRDMVQAARLLPGMYEPRSMRGLAALASDLAAQGASLADASMQRGWRDLSRTLVKEFAGTRLGRRLAWHRSYKRERHQLRQELANLQKERTTLRAQWKSVRRDAQRSSELGQVSAAMAENAARRKDLHRELKAQKKLRKHLAKKQKRHHEVKALSAYAKALRKEHKALRQEQKALRAEYRTLRTQHNVQVKAAQQELRERDRASKRALHEKRQALTGEQNARARQYKQLRRELTAGSAEVRQARRELRALGRRHKEAMREAQQAMAVQQSAARERLGVRSVELDKARDALAELGVSMKLHRYELAHLARTRKGVARNDARSLAESSRIFAALARSTTPPERLRDQAAAVREQQTALRAVYDAQRATRDELAHQYRQLPRHERSKAQRAEIAALDGKLKATRAELAELGKLGKALVRREQSSLALVLRHARRENADRPSSDRPARMRWRSEKGRHLLTAIAHTRRHDELRQDLVALQTRRKLWTLATHRAELTDVQRRRVIDQVTAWQHTPTAATGARQQAETFAERCKQVALRIATHDDASGRIENYRRIKENQATFRRTTITPEPAPTVEKPAITIDKEALARTAHERGAARARTPRPVRDTTVTPEARALGHAQRTPERVREAPQTAIVVDKDVITRTEATAHVDAITHPRPRTTDTATLIVTFPRQLHLTSKNRFASGQIIRLLPSSIFAFDMSIAVLGRYTPRAATISRHVECASETPIGPAASRPVFPGSLGPVDLHDETAILIQW